MGELISLVTWSALMKGWCPVIRCLVMHCNARCFSNPPKQVLLLADKVGALRRLWWEVRWRQSHCWGVTALEHAVHLCSLTLQEDAVHRFGQVLGVSDKCGTADWQEKQFWRNWLKDLQHYPRLTKKTTFPWAVWASFSHTEMLLVWKLYQ